MKILIAYDGSVCSDNAIVDLRRAGLPAAAEAMVLSVAEKPHELAHATFGVLAVGAGMPPGEAAEEECWGGHRLEEAREYAAIGVERLRADFPGWQIGSETWADSARAAIIRKAHAWNPDLIVLGSHGRSGIVRLVLGSVSQDVLNHVKCSVRISRHHLHSQERTIRLLIGVDGSSGAKAAVQAVAKRSWPAGTEARVVGVLDSRITLAAATTLEGAIPVEIEDECRSCMCKAVGEAERELAESGLQASHQVLTGRPEEALISEAEKWGADCVFLGARGLSQLGRILLGSVSTSVASHAHCSVEVVREGQS